MKQIALLHYTAPPILGETENTIYHHVRLLNQAGYAVRVIGGNSDAAYYQMSFHHRVEFVSVEKLDPAHKDVRLIVKALQEGGAHPEAELLTASLIEQLKPLLADVDVCIVYNALIFPNHLPLSKALHRLSGKSPARMIAWGVGLPPEDPGLVSSSYWDLLQWPWPGVKYVAGNPQMASYLADKFGVSPEQIAYIPSGIDPLRSLKLKPLTSFLLQKHNLLGRRPVILYPTSIAPGRQIEYAIHTIAALQADFPKAQLLVIAPLSAKQPIDPTYLAALRELANEQASESSVHLIHSDPNGESAGQADIPANGPITEDILADLFLLADLLFLPDQRKVSNLPLLEAGLARLPVFSASPSEFPPEWVEQFSLDTTPSELAAQISAYLKAAPRFQMRQQVIKRYRWSHILQYHLIPLIEDRPTAI